MRGQRKKVQQREDSGQRGGKRKSRCGEKFWGGEKQKGGVVVPSGSKRKFGRATAGVECYWGEQADEKEAQRKFVRKNVGGQGGKGKKEGLAAKKRRMGGRTGGQKETCTRSNKNISTRKIKKLMKRGGKQSKLKQFGGGGSTGRGEDFIKTVKQTGELGSGKQTEGQKQSGSLVKVRFQKH